jgi:hypothetical protein
MNYEPGQILGWWKLLHWVHEEKKPGRSGVRWLSECRCGRVASVAYEQLQTGRSRACRWCSKAYRATEDEVVG